ncbi:septation protein SepH [Microbacterium sp. NC79]|uniref:septation protein SepH n=1 Tax=Microbacterium sp. NC79 TaxID=2851009 RepID=UPI001C2B9C41|nr:septation protein SepH [Microbacterium sp. NC79]MBV0894997.1 DUF3071 domain-containing protein [Microbacterium sp. NC79]
MDQLTIVGTEDDKLILATESGERFSVAIDDVLRVELRKARPAATPNDTPRASPRDIQMHIRAGLSAAEVAELLGTTVSDVERYEGPVLAEREHIVNQALAVPVLMGGELEPDGSLSFGAAIRAKLADVGAEGELWSSWKDDAGWTIKVEFTASDVDHDARWSFDPRRSTLAPLNTDATQLSRQGSLPEGLIPRLRALDSNPFKDDSRFDSGAFGPRRLPDPEPAAEPESAEAEAEPASRPTTAADAAVKRAPEPENHTSPDTADLLEALRRRRGQREPAPMVSEPPAEPAAPGPKRRANDDGLVSLFGDLDKSASNTEPDHDDDEIVAEKRAAAERDKHQGGRRKGRTSMPSWDDIVFGARTDE